MTQTNAPTVRARRLARELRSLRDRHGLTIEQAATRLGWSYSRLRRYETARVIPPQPHIATICDLYDAPDRASLLQLARDAEKRGWWTAYADIFTGSYIALEDEASIIRSWQPQVVQGLLQTDDYAREVTKTLIDDPEEVQRRVQARRARQALLSREPDAPELHAIIDEAVLRRPIGSPQVMRGQLRALLEAAERPNVTVRVLPFDAGSHGGLDGSFVLLSYPDPLDPDIAYSECAAGEAYVESVSGVDHIRLAYDRIDDAAASPSESAAMISKAAEE